MQALVPRDRPLVVESLLRQLGLLLQRSVGQPKASPEVAHIG
jgi:hypothetical protein